MVDQEWDTQATRDIIAKRDVKAWDDYRHRHPDWMPPLSSRNARLDTTIGGVKWPLNEFRLDRAVVDYANLTSVPLQGARLSGCSAIETMFPRDCHDIHLEQATLTKAEFPTHADLGEAHLNHAKARGGVFNGVHLTKADLTGATLYQCKFDGANLRDAKLIDTHGLWGRDRAQTRLATDGEWAVYARSRIDEMLSWEALRLIGSLRVFGISYLGLALIVVYAHVADWYNHSAVRVREWAESAAGENGWLLRIPDFPEPTLFGLQLVATIVLALAATVYVIRCPSLVQENTETRWTRELKESVVEYRAAAFSRLWSRAVCASLFIAGGMYTVGYVGWRVLSALSVLIR